MKQPLVFMLAGALALLAASVPAAAQPPATQEAAPYNDVAELTAALTKPGRCPKGRTESRGVACAVVKYIAVDDPLDVIYRPIFRVVSAGGSELAAWTINLGTGYRPEVRKVPMAEVFKDIRTDAPNGGPKGAKKRYMPVDVYGYQDNKEACAKDKFSKSCHSSPRVQTDPFERYRFELPGKEVDKIWR